MHLLQNIERVNSKKKGVRRGSGARDQRSMQPSRVSLPVDPHKRGVGENVEDGVKHRRESREFRAIRGWHRYCWDDQMDEGDPRTTSVSPP